MTEETTFTPPQIHKPITRLFFFWVGILATTSYRLIIFFSDAKYTSLLKVSWYIGTVGFIIYFIHRFRISQTRAKLISRFKLTEKVRTISGLTKEEQSALEYIMSTLRSTKEKWNYIFIFIMSSVALIFGILTDFVL